MFFSISSRLRLSIVYFISLLSLVHANDFSLATSSVTYCEPPEAILIQYFDVAYIARNNSVFFNISAESVQDDLNVTANLMLNVYGLTPLNLTFDLCSIFDGVLCPLPKYHFKGSQTIQLPSSVDTSQIPGIAYHVPDLEGFAQLVLTDTSSGDVKACVQATLSNNWSTHQPAVSWATGAFTFVTLLLSLWQSSSSPYAILPFRLMDLLQMFQSIAATAFLSLNYPSAYRQFTINFTWAMGFITSSHAQSSIDNMRMLTGGSLPNSTSSSAVERVNRKLSPYNVEARSLNIVSFLSSHVQNLASDSIFGDASDTPELDASSGNVQTVTSDGSNVLQAGLPIYVNSFNVGTANAFMTMFFTLLVLAAIYLAVWLGAISFSVLQKRSSKVPQGKFAALYRPYLSSWGIRLLLVAWFPVMIFTMFQWSLKDSWLSLLFSIVTFLAILAGMVWPWSLLMRAVRQSSRDVLHSDNGWLSTFSPLYAYFRVERFYLGGIFAVGYFLKALVLIAAQGHGSVQVGLYLALEVAFLGLSVGLKPSNTRGGDIFGSFLAIIRLVCTGLLISFIEALNVTAIARVIIGLVMAVIFSVTILVIIINIVLHVVLWIRQGTQFFPSVEEQQQPHPSPESLEKGKSTTRLDRSLSEQEEQDVDRPYNPTPDRNVFLEADINQSYPTVTPTTTITTSQSYRTSGSTTVGSLLPSRWSFLSSPIRSTRPSPSSDTFSVSAPSASASHGHPSPSARLEDHS